MWTMLANVSDPLFFGGVAMASVGFVVALILWLGSFNKAEMSDGWILSLKGIKRALAGAILGGFLIMVSYAVDGVDEPYIKYVEKEVEVEVLPEFERIVNQCYNDTEDGRSLDVDDRLDIRKECLEIANDQYRIITKGPVRVIPVEKKIYTKIPFKKFMQDCGARGKATGQVAIEARTKVHEQCLEAAGTHFRGLVARNQ